MGKPINLVGLDEKIKKSTQDICSKNVFFSEKAFTVYSTSDTKKEHGIVIDPSKFPKGSGNLYSYKTNTYYISAEFVESPSDNSTQSSAIGVTLWDVTIKVEDISEEKEKEKEDSSPTSAKNNSSKLVTLDELKRFGWITATTDFENKLNAALKKYGITNKGSIALLMATMAEESGFGAHSLEVRTNFTGKDYGPNDMGAGYIQITHGDTHKLFLKTMNDNFSGANTAKYISNNYPIESAVWFWSSSIAKKTSKGSLNNYVEVYGTSKGIFLVTQYYINGWPKGNPGEDLSSIRAGASYDDTKGVLKINGHTYKLPINWDKRSENYDKAIKIWG